MKLTPIEKDCIRAMLVGKHADIGSTASGENAWIGFGLSVMLEATRIVRRIRSAPFGDTVRIKEDGSPVTNYEYEIESFVRHRMSAFCPEAVLVGEESGGEFLRDGITIAVDPVDGTWALLNRTETCTSTLAVFRGEEPFFGIAANPATGEIGYALAGSATRLIQLSMLGDDDAAFTLPLDRKPSDDLLVNLHPSRRGGEVLARLIDAWTQGEVNMVRSSGGAPTWAFLEAAKGKFVYVNLWSAEKPAPYDLAPGVMLVRSAGGEVTDLDGDAIDVHRHVGPFVASVAAPARQKIAEIVRSATST